MPCNQDEIERIPSQPMSDEDRYYLERAWKEPVESISRIEDTANRRDRRHVRPVFVGAPACCGFVCRHVRISMDASVYLLVAKRYLSGSGAFSPALQHI